MKEVHQKMQKYKGSKETIMSNYMPTKWKIWKKWTDY